MNIQLRADSKTGAKEIVKSIGMNSGHNAKLLKKMLFVVNSREPVEQWYVDINIQELQRE